MAIVLGDDGKVILLRAKRTILVGAKIHLYQNDYTPVHDSAVSDFTEANFPGYMAQNLSSWGYPYLNAAFQGEIDHPIVTWLMTGSSPTNNIYGYYVTTFAGDLLYAERNPSAPVAMDAAGKTYSIVPQFLEDTL